MTPRPATLLRANEPIAIFARKYARVHIVGALAAVLIIFAIFLVTSVDILLAAHLYAVRSGQLPVGFHEFIVITRRTTPERVGWLLVQAGFAAAGGGIANDLVVGSIGVANYSSQSG